MLCEGSAVKGEAFEDVSSDCDDIENVVQTSELGPRSHISANENSETSTNKLDEDV